MHAKDGINRIMKAIPISEIDSKIEVLTGLRYNDEMNKIFDAQLRILKEIKQKAIPAYTLEEATALKHGIRDLQDAYQNVIEESIPISKIDEKVNSLEVGNNYCYECGVDYQEYAREILEDLKNEN